MSLPRNGSASSASNRNSNALRASVLDAALELGIGNLTVAKWMFDPVEEGDEEEEEPHALVAPSLTTTSTVTSEDSYQIISSPPSFPYHSQPKDESDLAYPDQRGVSVNSSRDIHIGASTSSQSSHTSHVIVPTDRAATTSRYNKLRKIRPDDYESDGGFMSDRVGSKKQKNKKKDKDKQGGYASEGDSILGKKKKDKAMRDASLDGEESDGGSLSEASAKRKKSFFRRNKSKPQQVQQREIVPPLPQSSLLPHSITDRFWSRSTTPSSSTNSTRGSLLSEVLDASRSVTPTTNHTPRHESIPTLTQAFKEDAQSIAGSIDWSNAYSHFPRAIRSPQPPLPSAPPEIRPSRPVDTAPAIVAGYHRQLKTRPSPLLLSPFPSDYGHASAASPVPSETATITLDPKSTATIRRSLLEAAATTPNISWTSTNGSTLTPSPTDVTPSSDYIVSYPSSPLASPGGALRPRSLASYDLPSPSPPPSGPLPKPPPPPEPSSSRMKQFTLGSYSTSYPMRSASPGLLTQRGRESPFPVNPVIRVHEQLQQKPSSIYDPPTPFSDIGETPALQPTPWNEMRQPEIYVDAVSDDGQSEVISNPDVDLILSVFRDQNATAEEDAYLNMESDPEDEDETSVVDRTSIWNRSSFLDGEKSVETRSRFVRNVEATYNKNGSERERVVNGTSPSAPPIPPRSILRNGTSRS